MAYIGNQPIGGTLTGGNILDGSISSSDLDVALSNTINGKVTGPASSTDNTLLRFDGTTGKIAQASTVTVDDNGNLGVGLGAGTPQSRLHVWTESMSGGGPATSGSAADPNCMARLSAATVAMDFGAYASGVQWIQTRSKENYTNNFSLILNPNGGAVGIGNVSAPASLLHLETPTLTWALTFSSVPQTGRQYKLGFNAEQYFQLYDTYAAVDRFVINTSGNMGLGAVPSAWNTDYKTHQIGKTSTFFGRVGSNQTGMVENAFRNSSGTWSYTTNGTAHRFELDNGNFFWYSAPSGLAGAQADFQNHMLLNAGGNLLLGTNTTTVMDGIFGMAIGSSTKTSAGLGLESTTGKWLIYTQDSNLGKFQIWDSAANLERLIIDPNGNVVVGGYAFSSGSITLQQNGALYTATESGIANTTLIGGIGGVSNGYLIQQNTSNHLTYTWGLGAGGENGMTLSHMANLAIGRGLSPSAGATVYYNTLEIGKNGCGLVQATSSLTGGNYVYLNANATMTYEGGPAEKYANSAQASSYEMDGASHKWKMAPTGTAGNPISWVDLMTLGSDGALNIGTNVAYPQNGVSIQMNSGTGAYVNIGHPSGTVAAVAYIQFLHGTTPIGSIYQNGASAVFYATTSDVRLKKNISNADSGSNLIDALQVRKFDWKADGSHQRYGFVAQELDVIYPEAVVTPAEPDSMMSVDYAKLVPLLVQEIQSLRARVAALELV